MLDNAFTKADAGCAESASIFADCNQQHISACHHRPAAACQPAHPDAKEAQGYQAPFNMVLHRMFWTTMLASMHDAVQTCLRATAASPLAGEVSTLAERMFCFQSYPAPLPSQLRLDKQTSRVCSSLPGSPCNLVEHIWHQLKGNLQYAMYCNPGSTPALYAMWVYIVAMCLMSLSQVYWCTNYLTVTSFDCFYNSC